MSVSLLFVAALIVVSLTSIGRGRSPRVCTAVYLAATTVSLVLLACALSHLISGTAPVMQKLPIGIPWIGAHFRLDALAAFFLVVVNLGAAAASLYAIGFGRHEHAPQRVVPFYPRLPRRHEPGGAGE